MEREMNKDSDKKCEGNQSKPKNRSTDNQTKPKTNAQKIKGNQQTNAQKINVNQKKCKEIQRKQKINAK